MQRSARTSGLRSQPPCALRPSCATERKREVEDLERVPGAERHRAPAPRRCGSPPRSRLLRARGGRPSGGRGRSSPCRPDGPGVARRTVIRSAKKRAVVRPRQEVAPAATDDAEPSRHRREDVLQRPAAGPPELVRVRVDHPVGVVLGRGEPRHPRHPLVLAHVVARLAEEPQARLRARSARGSRSSRRSTRCPSRSRSRRPRAGGRRPARPRRPPRRGRAVSSRASRATSPEHVGHSVDDPLGRTPVDHADDLLDRPAALRGELVRMLERALDAGDDVLEALGSVERPGGRELLVVLPDDVLRRPRLDRAARPRRRARRRPAGRPRARRGGSCPRCRRRRRRAGGGSRAPRGRCSSPPARRRPPAPPPRRSAPATGRLAGAAGSRSWKPLRPPPAPTTRRSARRSAPRRARCSACSRRRARAGCRGRARTARRSPS